MIRAALLLLLVLTLPGPAWAQQILAGGPVAPDGTTEIQIDFPGHQKAHNTGGSDGAGLCVATSVMHSGRWQNERRLVNFQSQVKGEPGGSWPEKLDRQIARYAAGTPYIQYIGSDLQILMAALRSGRMPAVTYNGHDGVFYPNHIAHMVNLVHLDDHWACILDNNYIGERQLLWMPTQEFRKRWIGSGQGWAVFLLAAPPPPVPTLGDSPAPVRIFEACVGALTPPRPQSSYEWRTRTDDPTRRYLYQGEDLLGAWDLPRGYWRSYTTGGWAPGCSQAPLEPQTAAKYLVPNYGVRHERFPGGECYSISGRSCTRREALAAMPTDKDLPNDSNRLRLTVIGPESMRAQVLKDLAEAHQLAHWKERLLIQDYPPGHWSVSGLGFPAQGIVLQQPPGNDGRGKVLHVQADYRGPDDMASAIRKADDQYMPDRAPDLRRASSASWAWPLVELFLVASAALILYLLFRSTTHAR